MIGRVVVEVRVEDLDDEMNASSLDRVDEDRRGKWTLVRVGSGRGDLHVADCCGDDSVPGARRDESFVNVEVLRRRR